MQGNSPDEEYIDPHGECAAEIHRLRAALIAIRDSRQSGRLMNVEPVGEYITRVKAIASAALT